MPFQEMSGFPYQLDTEHYPDDPDHLHYLKEWNTRVITMPSQPQALASSVTMWVVAVLVLVAVVDFGVLLYFKKRSL
jgi:hypothetical protein